MAPEDRTDNTLANDATLQFTADANAIYRFELMLAFTAGTAEDFRFRVTRSGLSDADLRFASDLDNSAAPTLTWNSVTNCAGNGVTSVRMGNYIGYLITGSNPGDVILQWAQQTTGANPTTLLTGSMMMLRRVA